MYIHTYIYIDLYVHRCMCICVCVCGGLCVGHISRKWAASSTHSMIYRLRYDERACGQWPCLKTHINHVEYTCIYIYTYICVWILIRIEIGHALPHRYVGCFLFCSILRNGIIHWFVKGGDFRPIWIVQLLAVMGRVILMIDVAVFDKKARHNQYLALKSCLIIYS